MLRRLLRSGLRSRAHAAVLACALLFAQAAAIVHDLDPAAHAADHACELCLPASVLGGANVAGVHEFHVPAAGSSTPEAAVPVLAAVSLQRPHARGPPATS